MTLTVGRLVAYIDADESGLDRGLGRAERQLNKLESTATKSTGRMESAVSQGFSRLTSTVERELGNVESAAGRSGQRSGSAFADQLGDAIAGARLAYGEFDIEVDAEIAAALAALSTVDAALAGLDDRDVRVDVDTSSALAAVGEIGEAAGGLGGAFNKALSVIGGEGPANVALVVGAIELLPTVASLAASGVVFAFGSALAGVGIQAAAGADRVRHEWSELGGDLKMELGDAAAPLEDSLLKAADVARDTFDGMKDDLHDSFEAMSPGVDRFVEGLGRGISGLGDMLEPLGDAFGRLLGNLGDRMPDIMGNVEDAVTTFVDIMNEDPQMLANVLDDATKLLSVGADVLSWADEIKTALTLPIDPAGAGNQMYEAMFGVSPEQMMTDTENLDANLATLHATLIKGAYAARDVAAAGGSAAGGVRNLSDALEEFFDPAAKALDAEIKLKEAIKDADEAAKDQKLTGLDRLTNVRELTSAIADGARAEAERTGKTVESGKAFLDQLPRLLEWAGKNKAANDTVSALGTSLGITTQKTKDGTIAVDALGKMIQILPNGKKVAIDTNTAKGKAQLAEFLLYVARQKGTVDVHVRTIYDTPSGQKALAAKTKARGGIQSGDGRVQYMAAGGVLGSSSMSPPPHVATQATYIAGSNTVHGEAGAESYIPHSSRYRSRAIDILTETAEKFGLEVYGQQAAKRVTQAGSMIQGTGASISTGLDLAMQTVTETLGASGSLTSAVLGVGEAGGTLVEGWVSGSQAIGDSVTSMADTVGSGVASWGNVVSVSVASMSSNVGTATTGLGKEVTSLGTVIAKAVDVVRAVANAKSAGTGGSKGAVLGPGPPGSKGTGGSEGAILGPGPPGTGGSEGAVIGYRPPTSAAPAPLNPNSSGISGGSAGVSGWNTPSGVTVNIQNATVREEADIGRIGADVGFRVLSAGLT